MNKLLALTALLGLATACAPRTNRILTLPPEVATQAMDQITIDNARIIYYDITGSTARELRASMDKLRPKDPYDKDRPVDAYTDWYVSWTWPGYGTDDCDLSATVVDYRIQVILPHWEPPANAFPELVNQWKAYINNLVLHEKGHVDNILNHYLDVKAAIQNATCSTAEAEAQSVLDQLRQFDSNYDRETRHGETQGAVFP
jgi:predicted secreted Zn-dependent protease